ncbi:histidine kinase/DNA gyrase B/HSP90-like ATPase [Gelidibacter algens]|uniref:histidine kinase n=1 Tax=Gelidibacter algens TaxID=49280 RepID=A0A327RWZ5_9FLAO|nr:histidine kinase/DNA gyrase B/HSP90-like ATPase [Gelidibacter algens]
MLILFFSLQTVHPQQIDKRDSLMKLLVRAKEDTGKAMLLLRLADYYETNNQDSSVYYLEKSKALSESLKFEKGLYHYYEQSAIVSFTKGDYGKAMEEQKSALALARELKDSSFVINTLNNIGIVYSYLGKFEEQLDYTLQVKNMVEAIKDSSKISGIYHNLANCYANLKQYRKSTDYALLSVQVHTRYNKRNDYINRVYATLGQNYEDLQIIDSALYYYDKAIKESVRLNDTYAEAAIYGYKSNLYANRNQFREMLKASERSLSLARELQSRQMLASSLYNVAYANFFNDNNAKARKEINEALLIATEDSLTDELKNSYIILSYIAAKDGDYATSLLAKIKSDSIQEAILNEQVIKSAAELENKYETEKKDNQIELQTATILKKNVLNYILIGSAITILIIFLLSYRTYKHKRKLQQQRINELETEKQLTATEAVLKGEEQERTRLAKDLHDGLGGMLSGIKYSFTTMKGNLIMTTENAHAFERSMDMLDSSIKEMRRVAHNMMPEALVKYGLDTALKDFCNDINQSGALKVTYQSIGMETAKIDQTTAITIYRIVQELISNTMKHATAKSAIVQLSKVDGPLNVTVEDDGKGFDTQILQRSKGIGWTNIQSRVDFLKGKLDVQSANGKGTSVHIEFNI